MEKKILKKLILLTLFTVFSLQLNAQKFTFSSDLEGWTKSYGANSEVTHAPTEGVSGDGALQLQRTGKNSNFGIKVAGAVTATGIDAEVTKFIRIRYKNGTKGTQLQFGGKNGAGDNIKNNSGGNIQVNGISAESSEYTTSYIDMSSYTGWSGVLTNFHMLVRQNDDPITDPDNFFLDEIEFLTSMPATTYSEFIQNPSFDGITGIAHISGSSAGASRSLTTAEFHDGTHSLGYNYSADATAQYWAFSTYEKKYSSVYTAGSDVQIKMWVKTNRTTPITMQTRLKLTNAGVENTIKPIATVSTTNTTMGWEELTFDIEVTEDFDGVILFFNILWVDETEGAVAENLNSGDLVYVDQMSATLTLDVLNVENNFLEAVNVFVDNKTKILNVKTPVNSTLEVYNILGRKVKSIQKLNENNKVSVSGMESGVYIIRVNSEGKSFTKKIILD